jgi:hypothetical protein
MARISYIDRELASAFWRRPLTKNQPFLIDTPKRFEIAVTL